MEYFAPRRVRPSGPSRLRGLLDPHKVPHRRSTAALSEHPSGVQGGARGQGRVWVGVGHAGRPAAAVLPAAVWSWSGRQHRRGPATPPLRKRFYLFLKISAHFIQSQYHRRPPRAEQQAYGFYNNLNPPPSPLPPLPPSLPRPLSLTSPPPLLPHPAQEDIPTGRGWIPAFKANQTQTSLSSCINVSAHTCIVLVSSFITQR